MWRQLDDWEVLHNFDLDSVELHQSYETQGTFHNEGQDGIFKSDYFSLHHPGKNYVKASDESQVVTVESENSTCVGRNSDDIFLDLSANRSDEYPLSDLIVKSDQGFLENKVREEGFDSEDKIETKTEPLGELIPEETKLNEIDVVATEFAKSLVGFEEFVEAEAHNVDLNKYSDREGLVALRTESVEKNDETTSADNINKPDEFEMSSKPGNKVSSMEVIEGNRDKGAAEAVGEGQNRSLPWWKMPLELFKYCVFKDRPFWSLSVLAAVMGFVLLRRRLYNMKKKVQSLHLKITLDDKVQKLSEP